MAFGGATGGPAVSMLKSPQTALQMLLEEINFQRTKEMRQSLKDDGGFVVLQGTTYWTDLFVRHFLFQSEPQHSIDCDDLLFFVRKKHIKGSSRVMPKYETEIEVFRKDSRKLPIGDPDVDWEETVYLNLVIHQFDYTLTLAICTRTSPKELQVLRRHSQKVYASPSRRKMDTKGESEEITYPHICFMVDNFDEVFHDILVRDGEMVCVELVATDRDGSIQGVIFLGSIRYDALKKVYDARQSSLSSKVAQRMSFGLFSSGGPQTRCEFVRMKGPQGKGHAEMAVTKPKGSGVETPTSEPGFCATDMWDSEWEEDCEEYYNYRHQRRLSDPSANLNNFNRYGWRTKTAGDSSAYGGSKARSENEGLDCLANEVSEIEAGDLRDDRPASSVSDPKLVATALGTATRTRKNSFTAGSGTGSTGCCNCFGARKRWSDTGSAQMSDVYYGHSCPKCSGGTATVVDGGGGNRGAMLPIELHDSPACLSMVSKGRSPTKHRNHLLIVESELEYGSGPAPGAHGNKGGKKKTGNGTTGGTKGTKGADGTPKRRISTPVFRKRNSEQRTDEKKGTGGRSQRNSGNGGKGRHESTVEAEEYEIADDAVSLDGGDLSEDIVKIGVMNEFDSKRLIRVNGKEEFPAQTSGSHQRPPPPDVGIKEHRDRRSQKAPTPVAATGADVGGSTTGNRFSMLYRRSKSSSSASVAAKAAAKEENRKSDSACNGSSSRACRDDYCYSDKENGNGADCEQAERESANGAILAALKDLRARKACSTLPKVKKPSYNNFYVRPPILGKRLMEAVPKRRTPDGTDIYYWCDYHPKKAGKELDDGAYNPLWTTKGFTQTFHFWKENRRQQSTPLNAFLTYVTLPWWSIAKDLLDHREQPILTF